MTIMANRERDARREQKRRKVSPLEGSPTDAQDVPGWSGRIMVWLRVATQLVGIQLLMLAGIVLGLVVAGVGPALASGGALLARVVDGDPTDHLWRDFWAGYRAQLPRAALVVAPALLVVGLAWYEMLVLQAYGTSGLTAVLTGTTAAVGLYATAYLAYAPAVLRRYGDPPLRTARFLLVAPLVSPLTALGCMVTAVAFTVIGLRFVPVLLLAGMSVPVLLTGILVDRFLDKVDSRNDEGDDEPPESSEAH
ncbi:YesL family protein [Demequina sp.]|uniref:YesL family protein n=1 Tax=Demequina sp. TaxID=2050685 RepID=UPI003A8492F7